MIDKDGMRVAFASTVDLVFGSRAIDPETSVILNDEVAAINRMTWGVTFDHF